MLKCERVVFFGIPRAIITSFFTILSNLPNNYDCRLEYKKNREMSYNTPHKEIKIANANEKERPRPRIPPGEKQAWMHLGIKV